MVCSKVFTSWLSREVREALMCLFYGKREYSDLAGFQLGIAGFSHLQHNPVGTSGYWVSYIFLSQGFCEVQEAVTLSIYLYVCPLVIALKRINFHVVSYCCIIWDKVLIYGSGQPGMPDRLPQPLKYYDFTGNHHYIPMVDSDELDNNKAPTITAPSQESSASSCGDSTPSPPLPSPGYLT